MSIREWVKNKVRNWLNIAPARPQLMTIYEPYSHETNVTINEIWYRGKAYELQQLYHSLRLDISQAGFWSQVGYSDNIRKIHSGLPALMVDTLAGVVTADMAGADFCGMGAEKWAEICRETDFTQLVKNAVTRTLAVGDGAFKISCDTDISNMPMVEFFSGNDVEYTFSRGRITAITFRTRLTERNTQYILSETYTPTAVINALIDTNGRKVPMNTVSSLKNYPEKVSCPCMMAVPLKFFDSPEFYGRGKSLYETKIDSLDALDEVISQWLDAIRDGRVRNYIPENLIPRNPETGNLMPFDSFGRNFVKVGSAFSENGGQPAIQTIQPEIRYDAFLSTYTATLQMCLQGIISPATLGIDLAKDSSGEAQREKKDVTGMTRNAITTVLEKTLPKLITAMLTAYDMMHGNSIAVYEPSVTFGEYSTPTFDAVVETVGKAKSQGIMSIERSVEELYGDSLTEEEKADEVARLKNEQGIIDIPEPSLSDNVPYSDNADSNASGEQNILNGAQISSLLDIVRLYSEGGLSAENAVSIISSTLGISEDNAKRFVGNGEING